MSLADKIKARREKVAQRKHLQRERSVSGTKSAVERIKERRAEREAAIQAAADRSRKAAEVARAERNSTFRGVDRVPDHLRNLGDGQGKTLVEHMDANYRTRRISAQGNGRTMRPGMNEPAHNPERKNRRRGKRRTANR